MGCQAPRDEHPLSFIHFAIVNVQPPLCTCVIQILLGTFTCTAVPGEFVWLPGLLTKVGGVHTCMLHKYFILCSPQLPHCDVVRLHCVHPRKTVRSKILVAKSTIYIEPYHTCLKCNIMSLCTVCAGWALDRAGRCRLCTFRCGTYVRCMYMYM